MNASLAVLQTVNHQLPQ